MKGTGNYVSDIDVYRGMVKAYFPNADVHFVMNIEINGEAPSEEEMAKAPEKVAPKPKSAPKKPAEKAAPAKPAPAKPAPQKKPAEPEIIQLTLF